MKPIVKIPLVAVVLGLAGYGVCQMVNGQRQPSGNQAGGITYHKRAGVDGILSARLTGPSGTMLEEAAPVVLEKVCGVPAAAIKGLPAKVIEAMVARLAANSGLPNKGATPIDGAVARNVELRTFGTFDQVLILDPDTCSPLPAGVDLPTPGFAPVKLVATPATVALGRTPTSVKVQAPEGFEFINPLVTVEACKPGVIVSDAVIDPTGKNILNLKVTALAAGRRTGGSKTGDVITLLVASGEAENRDYYPVGFKVTGTVPPPDDGCPRGQRKVGDKCVLVEQPVKSRPCKTDERMEGVMGGHNPTKEKCIVVDGQVRWTKNQ